MRLALCYSPLSPFCRKVRMAMDHKQLSFELIEADSPLQVPAWNPRAELPVLIHGDTVVCNSPDILAYLERCYPAFPLYPADARGYAKARAWERLADTQLDAVVRVIGYWQLAELPTMPPGLMDAARRDISALYDLLEVRLAQHPYLCDALGAADFAFYPHVAAAQALGLGLDATRHPGVQRWCAALRARPEGVIDAVAMQEWWAGRDSRDLGIRSVNWGAFRLEWLLANGHADWFAEQVRQGRVRWSTGPRNQALASPLAPNQGMNSTAPPER